ncbi:MAG: hypothetical protein KIS77_05145 [Saprospiraceae bacterium]|nr:hypothetical protein [Saprospiraceae bacterium]
MLGLPHRRPESALLVLPTAVLAPSDQAHPRANTSRHNHLNLPNSINNSADSYITLTYTDGGEKLTKVASGQTRNYVAGIERLGPPPQQVRSTLHQVGLNTVSLCPSRRYHTTCAPFLASCFCSYWPPRLSGRMRACVRKNAV